MRRAVLAAGWLLTFLLLSVYIGACASQPLVRYSTSFYPNRQTFEPMRPSPQQRATMRRLWQQVESCAGLWANNGKDLSQIKFFVRDPVVLLVEGKGWPVFGEWVPPDSIFITRGFERNDVILAHEMLHHKLNGYVLGEAHPDFPFKEPCELDMRLEHRLYEWSQ